MNVTTETLDDAIAHYAVVFNRVQWLDPARLDLQRQVWAAEVDRYGSGRPGELTNLDFHEAFRQFSLTAAVQVNVMVVVSAACDIAAARFERIRPYIESTDEMLFYEELVRYRQKLRAAETATDQLAADDWLVHTVESFGAEVMSSGLPDGQAKELLSRVNIKSHVARSAMQRPPLAAPSSQANSDADAAFHAWRQR